MTAESPVGVASDDLEEDLMALVEQELSGLDTDSRCALGGGGRAKSVAFQSYLASCMNSQPRVGFGLTRALPRLRCSFTGMRERGPATNEGGSG